MAQIVRISQTHWISLEQIITAQDIVEDDEKTLLVLCAVVAPTKYSSMPQPYEIRLRGEERTNLLALLARTASYITPSKE